MDPAIFESTYHGISIDDARLGLRGQVDITRYVSGWPSGGMDEFYAVLSVLARKLKLSGPNQVPAEFRLAGDYRIDPDEYFYRHSLRRAYECRASPDEIRDAIRLAFFAGRFKFPVTAQAYIVSVTSGAERTSGIALLGIANGLGFIAGPILGALLVGFGLVAPIVAAALLPLIAAALMWALRPVYWLAINEAAAQKAKEAAA